MWEWVAKKAFQNIDKYKVINVLVNIALMVFRTFFAEVVRKIEQYVQIAEKSDKTGREKFEMVRQMLADDAASIPAFIVDTLIQVVVMQIQPDKIDSYVAVVQKEQRA